jgi:hypothetical protein
MHGSYNLATFNATTYVLLISNKESQTQDWHQDFAPGEDEDWEGYFEKSEKLGMSPLSVIYSLEGLMFSANCFNSQMYPMLTRAKQRDDV